MPYNIRLPDGTLVQDIPDDVDPREAKRRILEKFPDLAPKTTFLGQAAELGKGLVPGAVGLAETALTGISAILPEEAEKAVREKVSGIATAIKEPFKAAPGYEESVSRKLSEAVGSTIPFLLAGPFGIAGRVGATALGVGAGAGTARTRAEEAGATEGQRATATALGTIPGALEIFAPFRILGRMDESVVRFGVESVKRAAKAGGEEAAQEAASEFAQNLIAKGIYKPEQELIEGLGESAAYGGATGAIIQGVMDLALGRRAKKPGEKTEALKEVEKEAAKEEIAKPVAEKAAEGAPDVGPTVPVTGGRGFEILEQPSAPVTAERPEGVEPTGVVSAVEDAGAAVGREGAEPGAVTPPVTEAPPVTETPPVVEAPAPAPAEAPAPAPAVSENYWRPNPSAPNDPNSWQDKAGYIHYKLDVPLPNGKSRVTEIIDQEQAKNIAIRFEDSKGNKDRALSVSFDSRGIPYWLLGDASEENIRKNIGDNLFNSIGNEPITSTEQYAALFNRVKSALESLKTAPVAETPAAPTPAPAPAAPRVTKTKDELADRAVNFRQELLDKRKAQAQALGIDLRDISIGEIQEQIATTEKRIGELYDAPEAAASRKDAVYDDETLSLMEELEKGRLSPGFGWSGAQFDRLSDLLDRNSIDARKYREVSPEEAPNKINELLAELNKKSQVLRNWDKLTQDQRDVYLDALDVTKTGEGRYEVTPRSRATALRALARYTQQLGRTKSGEVKSSPEAALYERDKAAYEKELGIRLPSKWAAIPVDFQQAFSNVIQAGKTRTKDKKTIFRQESVDQAFYDLTDSLIETGIARPIYVTDTDVAAAALKRRESKSKERAQKEIKEERKKKPKVKAEQPVARKEAKDKLPDHIVEQIKKGNLAPVLDYLRNSATGGMRAAPQTVFRATAQKIFGLKLKTQIKLVPSIQGNRLAEYDPRTDTISVTANGLTETTVLHELVHAATVKVLNKYLTGDRKGLTEEQIDAAEQLIDVMELAKKSLRRSYPEAFKDPYEFVSYAMTDVRFQRELAALDTTNLDHTALPSIDSSLWSELIATFAKMFGAVIKTVKVKGATQPGLTETNALLETVAAFENIVAAPEGRIEMTALAAMPTPDEAQTAQEMLERVKIKEHGAKRFAKALMTRRGYDWFVTKFQNDRRAVQKASERAERFGILKRTTDDLNDVYGQITRSTGIAEFTYQTHLYNLTREVHDKVNAYANKKDIGVNEALERLHLVLESRHEPERRQVKFLLNVPLDSQNSQAFRFTGETQTYSAEGMREEILRRLAEPDPNATPQQNEQMAKQYRQTLDDLVDLAIKNPKYRAPKIVQQVGKRTVETPVTDEMFNPGNERYNVVGGYSPQEIAAASRIFDLKEDKAELDAIEESLRKIEEETRELNRKANYWSQPVENLVNFYGFEHYVPFKGKPGTTQHDEDLNLDPRKLGGELQDSQNSFEGRLSEAENPLLQMLADGAVAALRYGRKDLTLAIKNAAKDKIIKGDVVATINFADRYLRKEDVKELGGPDKIFHYNPDGTIDIISLREPMQREAIRRSYRVANPLLDAANSFTSGLGQTHTRFNPAFGPMNFVRDALTNAFTLGAELGPAKAGKLITAISEEVATVGFKRSLQFAHYYSSGNEARLRQLAGGAKPYSQLDGDEKYFRDLLDYVEAGGKVSYLQGIAAKGQLDQLVQEVEKNGVTKTTKETISKVFDLYNEMFELSSRVSAYRILKSDFEADFKKQGVANAEAEAKAKAVEYTKNLANFEQVGEWGKTMGSLFMFFRPAATGAVRAIDALAPAFGFNEQEFRETAKAEGRTDEQIDRAVASMKEQTANARRMSLGLLGSGALLYSLAYMASGDDEEDRNKVGIDDMARWTRYVRLQIPGTEAIIQIPWGFGLGAFAAAGAQLASVASRNTMADALTNISIIGMDSFLPIPVSRISPLEHPLAWFVDSIFPSAVRPFVEYVMNLDGLGREIYNNRQSKFGDAYTGGDNIPEAYKDTARWLFNTTEGAIDISPNTLYFFASNYADGPAKIVNTGYNWLLNASGEKNFDPKNDLLFLSSFIGTKSNVDAREFSAAEKKIKELDKRIKSLKEGDPEIFERFLDRNPDAEALVDYYNQEVNRDLRSVRKWANEVRADRGITAGERKTELEMIGEMSNRIKRRMLDEMETLGYEP